MPFTGTVVLVPDYTLNIRQGSDTAFGLTYRETAPDGSMITNTFTGWTVRAQIRSTVGGDLWLSLASGSGLDLAAAADKLTITGHIAHAVTEASAWDIRDVGVWDIELVRADGTVIPLAEGEVLVTHDVTRA